MGSWNLRPKREEGKSEKGRHGPQHEVCGLYRSHMDFQQEILTVLAKGRMASWEERQGESSLKTVTEVLMSN